jgi:stage III sporulation protein AE
MSGNRNKKRKAAALSLFLLLLLLLMPDCGASQANNPMVVLPEEYREMLGALPEALRDSLPPSLLSADADEAAEALQALLSPHTLLPLLFSLVFSEFKSILGLVVSIFGMLLLRAAIGRLCDALGGGSKSTLSLLCRLCFTALLLRHVLTALESVSTFFDALAMLTDAYLPLMAAMYAMGGNVATAIVNQSTLLLSAALVSRFGGQSVIPVFSVCLALCIAGVTGGTSGSHTVQISDKIKKWYTWLLSLVMLLLSALLAAQTALSARADSLGFKAVRFIISGNIPIVGGSVAEMLRTAAAQLSFLRSLVGIGGIVLLLWLLLPTFNHVLLTRLVCNTCADIAQWIDCPEEAKLLREIGGLYGYLLAVIAVSVMTFFLSLVLLLRCAVAYG